MPSTSRAPAAWRCWLARCRSRKRCSSARSSATRRRTAPTLGIASIFLLERDFDSASRAFDAARSRTHDKDEQKFLSAALGDLATIKVR